MKFELRYFTGTGNSLKIIDTCKDVFIRSEHIVSLSEINPQETKIRCADIIGFCFPVYAFGIPRICRNYLKNLKRFEERQQVFVIITAGDADESGFALTECGRILKKKNCEVIYTAVVQMPINWTTAPVPPYPPSREEAAEIIRKGVNEAERIGMDITEGIKKYHYFNYPERFTRIRFYKDYLVFKYLGLSNLWRTFRVYETCNGCQLCAMVCPTKSIMIVDKKPVWTSTCEQCMRCVNFCPKEAVYQSMGGDTKGKNRYHEPGFNPGKR